MASKFCTEELADFARWYGFHYDNLNEDALVKDFIVDMERGLKGETSSMPMLPSYLKPASHIDAGRTVIALDAGGTNLRASRVTFDAEGHAHAEGTKKIPMPGTQGRLSAPQFFDALADLTAPLIENAGGASKLAGIGFCFSYAMNMTPDGDGVPIIFSKELDIPEVVGKPIGAGLREALLRKNIKAPERICLLNDTVSTLLTGVTAIPKSMPSKQRDDGKPGDDNLGIAGGPVIGLILGTGFNTAYPEMSIPKIGFKAQNAQDAMVVVAESGTYFNRYQGRLDKEFDSTTKNPGGYTTEKTTSGAYLGPLCLHIFKQAIKDKVISFAKQEQLLAMEKLETRDLNTFLHSPLVLGGVLGSLFSKADYDALCAINYLCSIVNERASIFSASVVAGTAIKTGGGMDPASPVRIAVEGTTFSIYAQIRRSLEAHLHTMLCREKPFHYIVQTVEQASLIGAAVAALSN